MEINLGEKGKPQEHDSFFVSDEGQDPFTIIFLESYPGNGMGESGLHPNSGARTTLSTYRLAGTPQPRSRHHKRQGNVVFMSNS